MKTFTSIVTARWVTCLLFSCFVFRVYAQTVSTIAGGGGGYKDGAVSNVELYNPSDVIFDLKGNLIIADQLNHRIRKISPSGVISNFAGNGVPGFVNGAADTAEFNGTSKMAIDKKGNIYVCDNINQCIRKINTNGIVSTFAGNGTRGFVNGNAAKAEFWNPSGIGIDTSGNLYIGDFGNNCIRKITPAGVVSTFAGNGSPGYVNGTGTNARFYAPRGVAVDVHGNVYVADCDNQRIRKITRAGVVSLFAGNGYPGTANGQGANAEFTLPDGVSVDYLGNVYVGDQSNNLIRKITPAGVVSTIAGNSVAGFLNGINTAAELNSPHAVCVNSSGTIFIADGLNNCIRKLSNKDSVSTYAGNGIAGYVNGSIYNAEMYGPNGVTVDAKGNIYIAEWLGNRVRKLTPDGVLSTIAGNGIAGFVNGKGSNAEFNHLSDIVVDTNGNIFVTEAKNNCIRKITPNGNVTTFAGNGTAGYIDGKGTNAEFWNPNRLVFDKKGNLIIADAANNRIRKITPSGVVSTIAGNGYAGFADGAALSAEFSFPNGVAIDAAGSIYVADYNNNLIRKISNNTVSTVAGNGHAGYVNGKGTNAEFNHPGGICINSQGKFYISDESSNRIRKMTADGDVSLVAGNGVAGDVDGDAGSAEFNDVRALCVDNSDNILVPDYNNNHIRKISFCDCSVPPTGLRATKITSTSAVLKWNLIDCALGYNVEYRKNGTSTWTIKTVSINKDSTTITELKSNTTYQCKIATKCSINGSAVYSDYSSAKTFTTDASFADEVKADVDNASIQTTTIKLFPNPASNNITVEFNTNKAGIYTFELTDASGIILQLKTVSVNVGSNEIIADICRYSQGIYFINITDKEHRKAVLKFNKE